MKKRIILSIKLLLLKLQLKFSKIDLFLDRFNRHLPRFFKLTKVGLLTTFIAFLFATSFTYAASTYNNEDSNLYKFQEEQNVNMVEQYAIALGAKPGKAPGVLQAMNGMVGKVYEENNTVSASEYIASELNQAKLIDPVYAAASGYVMLNPARTLWNIFKKISLSFLVIISVVLAIMVLLRVREGQGYISVVSAFPKIAVTIALIYFSYPIAGAIMDISNIASNLTTSMMINNTGLFPTEVKNEISGFPYSIATISGYDSVHLTSADGTALETSLQECRKAGYCPDYNIFRLMSRMTSYDGWGTRGCNPDDPPEQHFADDPSLCKIGIRDVINTPTGITLIDQGIGLASTGMAGDLLSMIITIMLIMIIFKVFVALLMAFLQVLMRTIFAPIQFLTIPIKGYSVFADWAKGVLAYALVFPATLLLLIMAAVFANINVAPYFTSAEEVFGDAYEAPLLLSDSLQTLDNNGQKVTNLQFLGKLLAVGLLTIIPTVPNVIKEAFAIKSSGAIAGAPGNTFKAAASKVPVVGKSIAGLAG